MCESDRDVKVKTEIKAGSEIKNARKEDKEYIYDTLGIPYEDLGHSKKNEWTLLENDRYVFLKRIVYEEANGIGTKIIRKEFSICADVEKGRLFVTPDNKKNKAGFYVPDEQYKKMRSILLNRCKKHFGFTPEYEWGETNFEKLKNYIQFPVFPEWKNAFFHSISRIR